MLSTRTLPQAGALLLALIVLVSSCAGLGPGMEPPGVNLARISVQEVRPLETVFLLDLRVHNTNDAPLPIGGVDCDLEVDGRHLATGVSDTDTTVPALSSKTVRMAVYASSLGMAGVILDRMRGPDQNGTGRKLGYTLRGRLHLEGTGPVATVPFSVTGNLAASSLVGP
jgi:LEA14-like dessication related protein